MNNKVPIPNKKFPDTNQNACANFTIFMFSAYFKIILAIIVYNIITIWQIILFLQKLLQSAQE